MHKDHVTVHTPTFESHQSSPSFISLLTFMQKKSKGAPVKKIKNVQLEIKGEGKKFKRAKDVERGYIPKQPPFEGVKTSLPRVYSDNTIICCIMLLKLNRLDCRLIDRSVGCLEGLLNIWNNLTNNPNTHECFVWTRHSLEWRRRSWGTRLTISAMWGTFGLVSGSRYF